MSLKPQIRPNRATGKVVECFNCEEEFYRTPSQMKERNYCSRECVNTCSARNSKIAEKMKGENNPMKREEVKKKVSEALKGQDPWNKGLTIEDPRVAKYIETKTGMKYDIKKENPTWFERGHTPHNFVGNATKDYRGRQWHNIRKKILERDDYTCQRCGEFGKEVDHIVPWRVSKDNSEDNLQVLCKSCNSKKMHEEVKLYGRDAT